MKVLVFAIATVILSNTGLSAQEVKDFNLINVVDNQSVSLSAYPSCEGIVLIFTSNTCPYDEHYRGRISALANAYAGRVPVVLINAHTDAGETPEKMAAKARALGLTIPYLADKDQTVSSQLGVRKSPEVFLLRNDNGKFRVVYRGAIDDNAQVEADVRHHYLRDAIDIMLARQSIETPEVRPVGCNLKRKL
jgi:peroxiredoxin